MATQRVLLLTIADAFADRVWKDICRWSDARTVAKKNEWSSDDWPAKTREEVDEFVAKVTASGYTPPILYRSEHVDCWSMGDVFQTALVKAHRDYSRQLLTSRHELIATWVRFSGQIIPDDGSPPETRWLQIRINEAIAAWAEFAENRLVILARTVLGGLWTDEEVARALTEIPDWWAGNGASSDQKRAE